jgi:hypothetical protein
MISVNWEYHGTSDTRRFNRQLTSLKMHYAYGLLFHSCMQKKAIKKIHGLPTSIIFSFRLTPCSNPAKESDERTMCTSGGGGNDLDVQLCPSPMTTFGVVLLSKVTRSE